MALGNRGPPYEVWRINYAQKRGKLIRHTEPLKRIPGLELLGLRASSGASGLLMGWQRGPTCGRKEKTFWLGM